MSKIILASASPRRESILREHGIIPTIIKPEVDENIPSGFSCELTPEQVVMYFSLKKGLAVYASLDDDTLNGSDYLISADTIVYDDRIIGKPANTEEAFGILKSLRNKSHLVITGVSVTNIKKESTQILYDISKVNFSDYSDQTIWEYIKTGSPLDKAGAYAIQSSWGEQVKSIEGDLENVIGLPWHLIDPIISE